MDAEHDLPAHAEDLDAAFVEAVANAGPHDLAEPHPAADLPLREPETSPAAVVPPIQTAVDPRESAAVALPVLAAVDECESVPVDPAVLAAVDERELAAVYDSLPTAVPERQLAVVDLTALGDVEERELAAGDLGVFSAGERSVLAAIEDRQLASVGPTVLPADQESVPAPVDEREDAVVEPPMHAAVREHQAASVPNAVQPHAWGGLIAAGSLAAIAGAVIVFTMLVPNARHDDAAAVDPGSAAVGRENQLAAVEQAAHVTAPPAGMPSGWRATDEWTGGRKKSVAYELTAERPVRLWMRQATPVLVVRCLAGTLDAFVVTGSASAIEPGRTDHRVQLAFDGRPAETERWTDSADHDGLFAPNGPAVFSRVASARTVRFTFTPHNAPAAEAVFNVAGAGALGPALTKHCR